MLVAATCARGISGVSASILSRAVSESRFLTEAILNKFNTSNLAWAHVFQSAFMHDKSFHQLARRPVAECHYCDLADLTSVARFSKEFAAKNSKLHLFVQNAGGCPPIYQSKQALK
jgi:hypothetical protein